MKLLIFVVEGCNNPIMKEGTQEEKQKDTQEEQQKGPHRVPEEDAFVKEGNKVCPLDSLFVFFSLNYFVWNSRFLHFSNIWSVEGQNLSERL